jgi:hypothetical protein
MPIILTEQDLVCLPTVYYNIARSCLFYIAIFAYYTITSCTYIITTDHNEATIMIDSLMHILNNTFVQVHFQLHQVYQ